MLALGLPQSKRINQSKKQRLKKLKHMTFKRVMLKQVCKCLVSNIPVILTDIKRIVNNNDVHYNLPAWHRSDADWG